MTTVEKTFAVALTIADNEAFTALATLRRLGLSIGSIARTDMWSFTVEDVAAGSLGAVVASIETIYNPNKHALTERPHSRPAGGEVWICAADEAPKTAVGGRSIAGVSGIRRSVAWQLFDDSGSNVEPAVLDLAVETFLCNPAFQKAIR